MPLNGLLTVRNSTWVSRKCVGRTIAREHSSLPVAYTVKFLAEPIHLFISPFGIRIFPEVNCFIIFCISLNWFRSWLTS